jgi:hypothetical protein
MYDLIEEVIIMNSHFDTPDMPATFATVTLLKMVII